MDAKRAPQDAVSILQRIEANTRETKVSVLTILVCCLGWTAIGGIWIALSVLAWVMAAAGSDGG